MQTLIYNFDNFDYSINEGNSYKKNLGILGPFEDWGYKIKASSLSNDSPDNSEYLFLEDPGDDDENFSLIYFYGDGNKSNSITLPKGSFIFGGSNEMPILQTRKNIKWWDNEENQNDLDDFLNSFVESKNFIGPSEYDPVDDAYFIMDELGMEPKIKGSRKKKDLHWVIDLEDGSEVELRKETLDDFLKNLRIYLTSKSFSPEVEIRHDRPGFETIFNTPMGKFTRKCERISDIHQDPINKYLFHASLNKDPKLYQEPVINYLNSILKSHDWGTKGKKDLDSFNEKEKHINEIKRILSNTISESDLDGMYSSARERYSPDRPRT
jgi:hypothetical protein